MRHHRTVPGTGSASSTDTTTNSTNATRSCDCSASQQPRGMERCKSVNFRSSSLLSSSSSSLSLDSVMFGPRSFDRFVPPSFIQREQSSRFQPTYPQMQTQIELPPTICLSDGEEPPPYKGPCTLALRSPEQQLELSRASVRAPPNRTVFDSDIMDVYGPRPPSTHSGKSASNSRLQGQGPPPTYSDVIGRAYPHFTASSPSSSCFLHQHSNNAPPSNQRKVKDGRSDKPT
ncbi:Low-density lipoprotein receptor class A domain-containing protein 4 [Bagarius yarrelli]|uniref:Low-density lipoprotein receptor class A domain-containing protein 4 n=1 Tax=Bagarius yarrelli TaxID=175774 RepID=A0A556V5B8_BAGYA|nr:Low-density lipoprotein receptor class A domain-containing protein 4 [Bagarius yarrelli]